MSRPRHADRLFAKFLDGEPLSPDDERHLATCVACQRAAAAAARLDDQLRAVTAPLASEPMPAGLLDVPPADAVAVGTSRIAPVLAAAAAVVLAVGLSVALLQLRPPSTGVPDSSPTPTPPPAEPTASPPDPTPDEPTPTAAPVPISPEDPFVVRAGERCADGEGGFSFLVPDGWAANRSGSFGPACRSVGPHQGGRGTISAGVQLSVEAPDYEPVPDEGTVVSQEDVLLDEGITATRYRVQVPESGALAASDATFYLVPLLSGSVLVATAATDEASNVDGLDAVVETLALQPSLTTEPAIEDRVEELYRDRDVCLDDANGWSVVYPDAWWTNTAVDGLDACSYYAPSHFEVGEEGGTPQEVEVSLRVADGVGLAAEDVIAADSATLMSRPALRRLADVDGEERYEVIVTLGDDADPSYLVGRTHADSPEDEPFARALLDAIMERIATGEPPPGAASTEPPITAPPISDVAESGDFRLELVVEQDRYRAGQPVIADAFLTYLGPDPSVVVRGSSHYFIGTSVRHLDGEFVQGSASTSDCGAHEIDRDRPIHLPYAKSGAGGTPDDPTADFRSAYFADPLLRLPPGRWEISAGASFYPTADDCGTTEPISLTVSVEIVVEP